MNSTLVVTLLDQGYTEAKSAKQRADSSCVRTSSAPKSFATLQADAKDACPSVLQAKCGAPAQSRVHAPASFSGKLNKKGNRL